MTVQFPLGQDPAFTVQSAAALGAKMTPTAPSANATAYKLRDPLMPAAIPLLMVSFIFSTNRCNSTKLRNWSGRIKACPYKEGKAGVSHEAGAWRQGLRDGKKMERKEKAPRAAQQTKPMPRTPALQRLPVSES
ncbi:MAG TPA: hypothetical protein VM286_07980 [Candidatus Thermoplasmatota archaeon]|nr:hypothetical protein [Candidatus Thermoplasmatota archaeon]